MLCVGAAASSGVAGQTVAEAFLLGIGVAGMSAALLLGNAVGAIVTLVGQAISVADERVNDVLFRQVFWVERERAAEAGRWKSAVLWCWWI